MPEQKGISRREFLKRFGATTGSLFAATALEGVSLGVARAQDTLPNPENPDAATARYYVEQIPNLRTNFDQMAQVAYGHETAPNKDELVLIRIPEPGQALILRFPNVHLPEGVAPESKKGKGSNDDTLRIRIQRAADTDPIAFNGATIPDDYLVYGLEHDLGEMKIIESNLAVESPDQAFCNEINMPNSDLPFMATFGVSEGQLYLYFPSQQAIDTDPNNPALVNIYRDLELGDAAVYRPRTDE